MSLTLKTASATNYVLSFVGRATGSQFWQKVGTSFTSLAKVSMLQSTGKTNTAKSRVKIAYPCNVTGADGIVRVVHMYSEITYTVPEDVPLVNAEELFWLTQTAAASEEVRQMVVNRAFTGA